MLYCNFISCIRSTKQQGSAQWPTTLQPQSTATNFFMLIMSIISLLSHRHFHFHCPCHHHSKRNRRAHVLRLLLLLTALLIPPPPLCHLSINVGTINCGMDISSEYSRVGSPYREIQRRSSTMLARARPVTRQPGPISETRSGYS